jgi:hypothetical protein
LFWKIVVLQAHGRPTAPFVCPKKENFKRTKGNADEQAFSEELGVLHRAAVLPINFQSAFCL